jgi:hypothetical protein
MLLALSPTTSTERDLTQQASRSHDALVTVNPVTGFSRLTIQKRTAEGVNDFETVIVKN